MRIYIPITLLLMITITASLGKQYYRHAKEGKEDDINYEMFESIKKNQPNTKKNIKNTNINGENKKNKVAINDAANTENNINNNTYDTQYMWKVYIRLEGDLGREYFKEFYTNMLYCPPRDGQDEVVKKGENYGE